MTIDFHTMGDTSIVITCGETATEQTLENVMKLTSMLDDITFEWILEYVSGYTTVTVFYDPIKLIEYYRDEVTELPAYQLAIELLKQYLAELDNIVELTGKTVEIPVCYGGVFGPDLSYLAKYHGLAEQEVIELHSQSLYRVYMIGFAPGFPYLGGLSDKLVTPRKTVPKKEVPGGSVGIGGNQTGIYSLPTPGGWQIIGRSPRKLFDSSEEPSFLLQAGDFLRFVPISESMYYGLEGAE